jgi:hypothetical protein
METSDVRRRVTATIERARQSAAERRARNDEAAREYGQFLDRTAIPLFRQVADCLKPGYAFHVFTPSGSVRLMSDARAEDDLALTLDTTGAHPLVMGEVSVARGRRVAASERPIGPADPVPIRELTESDVLDFLLGGLEQFVR